MPTPKRRGDGGAGASCGSIGTSERGVRRKAEGTVAATGLRRESNRAEAGDQWSTPQAVTSAGVQHGGVHLQPEVAPQQTERPPRDSPVEDTSDQVVGSKLNIQADGGGR